MSFPRYPHYKDSGVEWLGQVPEHWEVVPLCRIACERSESNDGMIEDNLLSLSYGHIVSKDITSHDGLLPDSFETYQIVRPGDIVLRLTDLQNDKRSLRSAIVGQTGIITSAYLAIAPTSMNPSYLASLFRAYDHTKVFYSMGGGLRQSMKYADMKRMPMLEPPAPEQLAIASFLDRETAKIDALVAEQRRLIDLLKEKRQAAISHAVTKGLNPNAPMKPSGIEWLGDVPEGWAVKPIRRVIDGSIVNGLFKKKEEFGMGVLLINVFDIYRPDFTIEYESLERVRCDRSEMVSYEVIPGDLFFVRSSLKQEGIAAVAVAGRCPEPVVFECHLIRARPNKTILDGRFGSFVLNSLVYRSKLIAEAKINTMTTIDQDTVLSTVLPIPPLTEQSAIVEYLETETAHFDTLTAEAQRAIDLLQERRTALISAAVTGQIDVRHLAGNATP